MELSYISVVSQKTEKVPRCHDKWPMLRWDWGLLRESGGGVDGRFERNVGGARFRQTGGGNKVGGLVPKSKRTTLVN